MIRLSVLFALLFGSLPLCASEDPGEAARSVWTAHVEQIFADHCTKCHAGVKQKGGVDLRTPQTVLKGGDNGAIVIPGNPKDSLLFKALKVDSDPHMPPEGSKQLNDEQIAIIERWIQKLPSANKANGPIDWSSPAYAATRPLAMPDWAAKTNLSGAIDRFVADGWKARKVKPAPLASDDAFARRLYLDLIGRIPTEAEMTAFETLPKATRRADLADQLLASTEYPEYMSEIFDVVFMERKTANRGRRNQRNGRDQKWMAFLENAFEKNRPWDQIIRQIILARPDGEENQGAEWFVYERRDNYQNIAEAISPFAFGVNIKCAQCHNHPLAPEIEQRHYWGVVAAFNRGKNVEGSNRGVSESAIGGFVNYADLRKRTLPAALIFPNGKSVREERPGENVKEVDATEKYVKFDKPSVPRFSRREELANAVIDDNPMLARAFVNRAWAMLMGRGLVHPVDSLDSRHPSSHPELLQHMAGDFAKNNYNIKRLFRAIILTRAYQLDSKDGTPTAAPESFARALDKPLPAEALQRALIVATTGQTTNAAAGDLSGIITERFPDLFAAEYNATLHQAMFFSNNAKLDELLQPAKENTAALALKQATLEDQAKFIFKRVLNRAPDREELEKSTAFLKSDKPEKSVPEFLWTLLASAEFQCNH